MSAGELDFCERCGVNLAPGGGLCRFCSVDDDFDACEFCHGTECTQECDDDLPPALDALVGRSPAVLGGSQRDTT